MERFLLSHLAMQAIQLGRPAEALSIADRVLAEQPASARVSAIFHARRGRALGLLGAWSRWGWGLRLATRCCPRIHIIIDVLGRPFLGGCEGGAADYDGRRGDGQRVGSSVNSLLLQRLGEAQRTLTQPSRASNAASNASRGCYDVLVGHGAGT
jgi:hypothetical protein